MSTNAPRLRRPAPAFVALALSALAFAFAGVPLGAQGAGTADTTTTTVAAPSPMDTSVPLSDDALFGGEADIVKVIDTTTASAGTVDLVAEKKTYPVFLVAGDVQAGLYGTFTPYGPGTQSLLGAVDVRGLAIDILPTEKLHFGLSFDGTIKSDGPTDVAAGAFADLRVSEFSRAYAAVSFAYDTTKVSAPTFSLDELFADTAIGRKLFFRLGKQRISWGVGYWYKPSDVLSLAAIDPDDPAAKREGPFAFKTDMPFGLNHATLYVVPPVVGGKPAAVSAAGRTDLVVGGFELSLAAFGRVDMAARPRAMFMFTGALGNVDVYGEAVAAWGADRTFVRWTGLAWETYKVLDAPVFQVTAGAKWDWSTSDGFGLALHLQGYYNGTGYADASILASDVARSALRAADPGNLASNLADRGMWYVAGSVTVSQRFGEGNKSGSTSLGGYALANLSDGSVRFRPSFSLSIGDQGSGIDLSLSALAAIGDENSQYAPNGNLVTPALDVTILDAVVASFQAPISMDSGFGVEKVGMKFGLYWKVISL